MCGICGIVLNGDEPVSHNLLSRACGVMRHRGPDHTGVWVDHQTVPYAGMAAVRLAVLDPSSAANQPIHDETGRFHLVFNGELYNFRELRRTLAAAGERFATEGDAEVVLAACARWGVEALQQFNGMWALAFFDSQKREGFLSRDPFGIKPLLYAAGPDGLRFASELRGLRLLASGDLKINPSALLQHLRFGFIAHPETIYAGIHRLAPGHLLRFDRMGIGPQESYAAIPGGHPQTGRIDYVEACTRLRQALANAISLQRVSDVPLGAFLSGGLDSSIVVAHLSAAAGRPLKTFAVGYEGQPAYDETSFARLVSQTFATEHHELILTDRDVLSAIPDVLDHLGEPFGDSSIIPTALLARFCRREVTVALSGDGGDELFGGYWRYLAHNALATYQRIPSFFRRLLIVPAVRALAASKSSSLGNRVRQFRKMVVGADQGAESLARHVAWSRIVSPEAEALFTDPQRSEDHDKQVLALAQRIASSHPEDDSLNRILTYDLQNQLPADMLQKVDLASMMHSLEVRVPFLDPGVVGLATSLPSTFKIDRGRRKCILLDAYRGRIPDSVLDRPKQGFEVPVGEYLRGPLRELYLDTVTPAAIGAFDGLSYDGANQVYRSHLERRGEHADLLFALLSLCWWYRQSKSESS